MIRYLLDTNAISESRKGTRANRGMQGWILANDPALWALSVITLGEIREGVELVRVNDPLQANALERWLRITQSKFEKQILPVTLAIAEEWGRLMAAYVLPVNDAWLAATALCHDLTVVTRNVADFKRAGVRVLNPFSTPSAGGSK